MCPPPGLARADRGELWKERSPVLIFAAVLSNARVAKPGRASPPLAYSDPLLHRHSVRPRRACRECGVEIHVEVPVEREAILGDFDHANVMVPLEMNLPEVVLIEEVIAHHQALVVVGERNHVRTASMPRLTMPF